MKERDTERRDTHTHTISIHTQSLAFIHTESERYTERRERERKKERKKERERSHLRVHALHLVLLQLKLHKVVDDVEELGRDGLEVLVVVVLDGQGGEDGVVDQGRAQVGQHAGRVLPRVFIKVLRYEVV